MTSESDKGPPSEETEAAASRRETRTRSSALGEEDDFDFSADEAAAEEEANSAHKIVREIAEKYVYLATAKFSDGGPRSASVATVFWLLGLC